MNQFIYLVKLNIYILIQVTYNYLQSLNFYFNNFNPKIIFHNLQFLFFIYLIFLIIYFQVLNLNDLYFIQSIFLKFIQYYQ